MMFDIITDHLHLFSCISSSVFLYFFICFPVFLHPFSCISSSIFLYFFIHFPVFLHPF